MVQIRVIPKTGNLFIIIVLLISGVTWRWHFLNHARLWGLMHKHITHNRCYERFADFRDAMLTFLREEVPRNWVEYCDNVSDNFRLISLEDLRILA